MFHGVNKWYRKNIVPILLGAEGRVHERKRPKKRQERVKDKVLKDLCRTANLTSFRHACIVISFHLVHTLLGKITLNILTSRNLTDGFKLVPINSVNHN